MPVQGLGDGQLGPFVTIASARSPDVGGMMGLVRISEGEAKGALNESKYARGLVAEAMMGRIMDHSHFCRAREARVRDLTVPSQCR